MTHKQTVGKVRVDLIPPKSHLAIAKVREFGGLKYNDPWGWKDQCKTTDFITAAQRHLIKIQSGELVDAESGLPHLYHALTSLAMAVEVDGKSFKELEQLEVKYNDPKNSD